MFQDFNYVNHLIFTGYLQDDHGLFTRVSIQYITSLRNTLNNRIHVPQGRAWLRKRGRGGRNVLSQIFAADICMDWEDGRH